MPRPKPLSVGDQFGLWQVVETAAPTSRGEQQWQVQCQCGRTATIRATRLRTGRSSGCRSCRQTRYQVSMDLTDPTWCWLLGVFQGDGYARSRQHQGGEVVFACKPENDQTALLASLEKVGVKAVRQPGAVTVHSVALARELGRFKQSGVGREKWLLPEQPSHLGEWLGGLFDADGHISGDGKEIVITQKDHGGMVLVEEALRQLGVEFSVYSEPPRKNSQARKRLRVKAKSRGRFKEQVPLRYPRKKDRLVLGAP